MEAKKAERKKAATPPRRPFSMMQVLHTREGISTREKILKDKAALTRRFFYWCLLALALALAWRMFTA